jgi:hypothetical protein
MYGTYIATLLGLALINRDKTFQQWTLTWNTLISKPVNSSMKKNLNVRKVMLDIHQEGEQTQQIKAC